MYKVNNLQGDIIRNNFLKFFIFAFILFLCVGFVSAHENDTYNVDEVTVGNNFDNSNFKNIIDSNKDKSVVNLDEKTYYLDDKNETHIVFDKSMTIVGIENKTVIDGKNTSLMLDVKESSKKIEKDVITPAIWRDGYQFKYLGKSIVFKNMTFKDVKMTTWHEMTFINCRFINSTFTSYEYSNTFTNCIFNKSKIEIVLFYGWGDIYKDHSKLINCRLYDSTITYKGVYTPNYVQIIGGDQFRITNSLQIKNSKFYSTNITLYQYNITVDDSCFNNSNIRGSSSSYNIKNTVFNNPKIELSYSIISLYNSNLTNPKLHFSAGYFSNGCDVTIEKSVLDNCKMDSSISYGSRKGSLKIKESIVNNSTLESTYSDVLIDSSIFNKSTIELFFADAQIKNSTFINDGNLNNTIKTRDYNDVYIYIDEYSTLKREKCQVKTNYTVENSYFVNSTGKYPIRAEDINKDTTHKITINQSSVYYFNDKLIIKVENYTGGAVGDIEIFIEYLNDTEYILSSVKTDSNGIAQYALNRVGNHTLKICYTTESVEYHSIEYGITVNITVLPTISDITVDKVNFKTNVYSNINGYLRIQIVGNNTAELEGLKFTYKVYTNGKSKTYYSLTDSYGRTTFKLPKTLTAGNHKIEIKLKNTNIKKTITVKIAKAKTTVNAPKVINKFKKSKYFKVTVKNKETKKAASNVKVKIKVYTGKKYKTYTVKTNKNGMVKINTKALKAGKHNVVICSGDNNYKISAKSAITIVK